MWPFRNRTSTKVSSRPSRKTLVGCSRGEVSLDEECVLEHFLGVPAEEFRKRLASGTVYYAEDFMYMAYDGLRYYLPVVYEYLQSPESKDSWEMSYGLLCSLSSQITSDWFPSDLKSLTVEIANYIDANREKFDIEPDDELFNGYLRTIRKHADSITSQTSNKR